MQLLSCSSLTSFAMISSVNKLLQWTSASLPGRLRARVRVRVRELLSAGRLLPQIEHSDSDGSAKGKKEHTRNETDREKQYGKRRNRFILLAERGMYKSVNRLKSNKQTLESMWRIQSGREYFTCDEVVVWHLEQYLAFTQLFEPCQSCSAYSIFVRFP